MERHFDFWQDWRRHIEAARVASRELGSVIVAATRGHRFFYELSHCVIPKELSPAAAQQHLPGMWALDPAHEGRKEG
ncbi:hypothetical protein PBY51_001584 [Eleginops maclovinus]|uniref:Uncharacterized protein n=1 Tax=Eleginops maclovinus TaxID=56733 RepID=A0AAN7WXP4_ELEMC|nr:hypothetical protein PBY51_001584 [Eleginops maclovinus]